VNAALCRTVAMAEWQHESDGQRRMLQHARSTAAVVRLFSSQPPNDVSSSARPFPHSQLLRSSNPAPIFGDGPEGRLYDKDKFTVIY
jgi:hypothetical protein